MGAFDELNNLIPLKFKFGRHNDIRGESKNEVYIGTMAVGLHDDGSSAGLYFGTGENGSYAVPIMPPPGVGILCGLAYDSSPFYAYPSFTTRQTPEEAYVQFKGTETYESDGKISFRDTMLVTETPIPGATEILAGLVTASLPQSFSGNKSFRDYITVNNKDNDMFGGITVQSNLNDQNLILEENSLLNPSIIFKQTHLSENNTGQILYDGTFYLKTTGKARGTVDANVQGDFYKLLNGSNSATFTLSQNLNESNQNYIIGIPAKSGTMLLGALDNEISVTDNYYSVTFFDKNGDMLLSNNGFLYRKKINVVGENDASQLILGNPKSAGEAGKQQGEIVLYTGNEKYIRLIPDKIIFSNSVDLNIQDYNTNNVYLIASNNKGVIGSETCPVYINTNGLVSPCSAIDVEHGGTGAKTAEGARTNLGFTGSVASIIGKTLTSDKALISNEKGEIVASELSANQLLYLTDVNSNIQGQFTAISNKIDTVKETVKEEILGADYTGSLAELAALLKDLDEDVLDKLGEKEDAFTILPLEKGGTGQNYSDSPSLYINLETEATPKIFNGSLNIEPGVKGVLPIKHGGTGLTESPSMLINLAATTAANILTGSPRPGVTGTLAINNGGTGMTQSPSMKIQLNSEDSVSVFTANPKPGVDGVLPIKHGGTGLAESPAILINLGATNSVQLFSGTTLKPGVEGILPVAHGGTGSNSLGDGELLIGKGTSTIGTVSAAEKGYLLVSGDSGKNPIFCEPSMLWKTEIVDGINGPVFYYSLNGIEHKGKQIPAATESAAGVITAGAQTFGGQKTFNADVKLQQKLNVLNNVTFGTTSNIVEFKTYGTTQIFGNDTDNYSLTVDGKTSLMGDTTFGSESETIKTKIYGTAEISGATTLLDALTVSANTTIGTSDANADLTVHGNAIIHKTLTIGGEDNKNNINLTVTGKATITNEVQIDQNLSVGNGLKVNAGITILQKEMGAIDSEALVINGQTSNKGNLIVGTNTLPANLTVYGTATVYQTLTAKAEAKLENNLTVNGNTTLGSNASTNKLTINGLTEIKSEQDVDTSNNASFTTLGGAYIKKQLKVDGNVTLGKDATTSVTVSGSLKAGGVEFSSLKVTGQTTLSTTVIDGVFNVNNNTTLGNASKSVSLTVYGNSNVTGVTTLGASGTDATANSLIVNGATQISGNATIGGNQTLNGQLTFEDANIDRYITFKKTGTGGDWRIGHIASATSASTTSLTFETTKTTTGTWNKVLEIVPSAIPEFKISGIITPTSTSYTLGSWIANTSTKAWKHAYVESIQIADATNIHSEVGGKLYTSPSKALTAQATYLILGNSLTASSSDGTVEGNASNRYGILRLYNQQTYYMDIRPRPTGATKNSTFYLPQGTESTTYATWYGGSATGGDGVPIYIAADGKATACLVPSTTNGWFGKVLRSSSDGVTELGRYLDFHATNDSGNNFDVRIDATTDAQKNTLYLPSISGQFVIHTNNTAAGSSTVPVYIDATGLATKCDGVVVTTGTQTFAGNKTFSGVTVISNTTDSTASSTGALQVSGGAYVAKQLRIGTNLTVSGNTTLGDSATTDTITINGATKITNTTNSTSSSTGALVISGGLGVTNNITAKTLHLTSITDAAGTSDTTPALTIGSKTGANIQIDANEILAKASASTLATLYLNDETNGAVQVYNLTTRGNLSVQGNATLGNAVSDLITVNGYTVLSGAVYGKDLPTTNLTTGRVFFKTI